MKRDLRESLYVDDVNQSEEEGQPVLNSSHVGQKAALRKYLYHCEPHKKKKISGWNMLLLFVVFNQEELLFLCFMFHWHGLPVNLKTFCKICWLLKHVMSTALSKSNNHLAKCEKHLTLTT